GMGSDNSRGSYDNIAVQVLPPQYTFDETEDFKDGVEDLVFMPVAGDWQIVRSRYEGVPAQDPAVSLVDLGLGRGLEANCILELEATFSTDVMGGFVFDYYGPQDFKFVMISAATDQVLIGHYTSKDGMSYDAVVERSFKAGADYTLFISLKGSTLSVSLDGYVVWGHVFNAITVDGDFGLLSVDQASSFDEVTVKTDDPAFREEGENLLATMLSQGPAVARSLTLEELIPIAEEAKNRWIAFGLFSDRVLAVLDDVVFEIVDLAGLNLGYTIGTTVQIDVDAARWGWFVDDTPCDDTEFTPESGSGLAAPPTSPAADRMDLLTAVMHELGHVLMLGHTQEGLMAEDLEPGMRYLPDSSILGITGELVAAHNAAAPTYTGLGEGAQMTDEGPSQTGGDQTKGVWLLQAEKATVMDKAFLLLLTNITLLLSAVLVAVKDDPRFSIRRKHSVLN
ncbi:MAG: hypothetical protein JSW28_05025, partial [Thermoplasmata archaeon]